MWRRGKRAKFARRDGFLGGFLDWLVSWSIEFLPVFSISNVSCLVLELLYGEGVRKGVDQQVLD